MTNGYGCGCPAWKSAHIFANSALGGSLGAAMLRVGDRANVLLVSSPPG